MQPLKTLADIAKGWYLFAQGSEETKQRMAERLAICNRCEYKTQMNTLGALIVSKINEEASIYKCGKCNCPLAGSTASPDKKCPMNLWPERPQP